MTIYKVRVKNAFAIGLPIALISILLPVSAISATKITPGTVCKVYLQKVTYQNKLYTCTKSGKKLIWDKGVAVAKPSPIAAPSTSPTSSPSPTPAPTIQTVVYPTDLTPLTLAAYQDFVKTYKSRLTDEIPNIEFIVEPHMDKVLEKQIIDNINVTAKFFANERPLSVPLRIWIAMSAQFQWIYDNMTIVLPSQLLDGGWLDMKLARAKAEPDGFMGGGAAGNTKSEVATLFFNGSTKANWGDAFWSQVPSHEFTHVVQRYELGNSMAPMLCWVREGNANYYGFLLAGRNSQAMYRNFWLQALSRIPTLGADPDFQSRTVSYWTDFFVQNESKKASECDPWINYILGSMAFQYLGGTYGNDAIQSFYLGLKDAWIGVCDYPVNQEGLTCPSWKGVFKKTFGITPEAAYPKFGQYIYDEIKWAKGKQVLWDKEALKIAPIPTS
jgi:hypothetical protein